jgi:hypothetical protein
MPGLHLEVLVLLIWGTAQALPFKKISMAISNVQPSLKTTLHAFSIFFFFPLFYFLLYSSAGNNLLHAS